MSDMNKRGPDCDDCDDGEHGERGKRGKRGHRGHDGRDGRDGRDAQADNVTIGGDGSASNPFKVIAPVDAFVYRPGATGLDAPGGNVYTDWALMMAAVDATKHLGLRLIEIDDRFVAPAEAVIPAGTWNMTDTKLINVGLRSPVFVEIADGAEFVLDPPPAGGPKNAMAFEGYGFFFRFDGTADGTGITPFDDISMLIGGNNVRFYNTDPAALPAFKAGPNTLMLFSGDNRLSGLGDLFAGISAAPVYEVTAGNSLFYAAGGGLLLNNVFTGNGEIGIGLWSHGFVGDPFAEFENLAFSGVIDAQAFQIPQTRYIGYGPVVGSDDPYPAVYNEYVKGDTTDDPDPPNDPRPLTVLLPRAATAGLHETVVVKDFGGNAGTTPITVLATGGDTVEIPVADAPGINNDNGCKIWVSDGVSRWMLTSRL